MHIETGIRWPKIVVGQVNSLTSGMGCVGGCVPTVGAALSPSLPPSPLNGFAVRRVVWPRRPPRRSRTAGVPWPAMSGACSLRAVLRPRVCVPVWVGFGIVNRQTCMLLSSGSGLDEDDP